MRRAAAMALCLWVLIAGGCSPDYQGTYRTALAERYGVISGETYQNSWVGLQMTLPKGWHSQPDPIRQTLEQAEAQVKDDQSLATAEANLDAVPVYNLVQVFRDPPAQSKDFNPSLVMMVEPVKDKGVPDAEAYLEASRAVMAQRQMPMGFTQRLDAPLDVVMLGGERYTHLPVVIETGLFEIRQDYYARMLPEDRMLGILVTWRDEAEREEMQAALDTLAPSGR